MEETFQQEQQRDQKAGRDPEKARGGDVMGTRKRRQMLQGALVRWGPEGTVGSDGVSVTSILGKSGFVGSLEQKPGSLHPACVPLTLPFHVCSCVTFAGLPTEIVSPCPLSTLLLLHTAEHPAHDTCLVVRASSPLEYKLPEAGNLVLFTVVFLAPRTVLHK